jgi:hypothetical protein
MTTTPTTRTNSNGQPRKTLATQLDRLDGILDGLDAALAGAVQEAVERAVKQAVQAVLTEVLTNRQLQEQLQQAAPPEPSPKEPRGQQSMPHRLWQATTAGVRRTVQAVQKAGRGVGVALLAAGGMVAGVVYATRRRIASLATAVYRQGKTLLGKAGTALTQLLPAFALGGT